MPEKYKSDKERFIELLKGPLGGRYLDVFHLEIGSAKFDEVYFLMFMLVDGGKYFEISLFDSFSHPIDLRDTTEYFKFAVVGTAVFGKIETDGTHSSLLIKGNGSSIDMIVSFDEFDLERLSFS